jgi:hypothetical protein
MELTKKKDDDLRGVQRDKCEPFERFIDNIKSTSNWCISDFFFDKKNVHHGISTRWRR